MYDLNRLRLLRELQRLGTVRAVAQALHYSPSTVSQQLGVLESEAGVALLEPVGRRVRLTPQGMILAGHADTILRQVEAARADIARSAHEVTGHVRIAGFQSVLLMILPEVIDDLARHHPLLTVGVVHAEPEQALPLLLTRHVDVVIAEEYPGQALARPAGIRHDEMFRDEMRLALPAGDPAAVAPRWHDLAERAWVVEGPGSASRRWLLDLCRAQGIEPDLRHESADLIVHEQLVARAGAVAILPDLLAQTAVAGVVRARMPDGPHRRRVLTACQEDAAGRPAVRACLEALRRHSPPSVAETGRGAVGDEPAGE